MCEHVAVAVPGQPPGEGDGDPRQEQRAPLDERVNAGWPAYKEALDANGKTYEGYIYEGANHGFHNDSTPRYDEDAAELAWTRTLDWFRKYLG